MTIDHLSTDVLVLGSGLAGMRAAVAALEHDPDLNVLVASHSSGPTGSSFCNANNMLGVQVLDSDEDREAFTDEVLELARPGYADRRLVEILAEESGARVRELMDLGLAFKSDDKGEMLKVPGCFSPARATGQIFTNTSGAHGLFMARLRALGANFLGGHLVRSLAVCPDRGVCGAVLEERGSGREVLVRATAVVAALGGPAPLFARSMAGRGASGDSYGMMARVGVRLANTGFIQFMWNDVAGGSLWPVSSLAAPGARVRTPDGRVLSVEHDMPRELSRDMAALSRARATHCPAGYGLEDAALDGLLADNLDARGYVRVHDPKQGWREIAPTAHAGNGGAIIDRTGATNVPGLFACGECATGMHGANRIGGAMVLATQVFGERAGRFAAKFAREADKASAELLQEVRNGLPSFERAREFAQADTAQITWLANNMQRYAVLGGRRGLASFHSRLQRKSLNMGGPVFKLRADSALTVTAHLVERMAAPASRSRDVQPRDSSITLAA